MKVIHALKLFALLPLLASANEMLISGAAFTKGIPESEILATDHGIQVVALKATPANEAILSRNAHEAGRCGGFEKINDAPNLLSAKQDLKDRAKKLLQELHAAGTKFESQAAPNIDLIKSTQSRVNEVITANVESHVRWFSSFRTRYHKSKNANEPVLALKARIEKLLEGAKDVSVETVSHRTTPQSSIRVTIKSANPSAPAVVLGGHLDSINGWGFGDPEAPGADDNASGVAALLEATRILAHGPRPAYDILVYLYAGEEGGLLGSAEIAQTAKEQHKAIRGVLQLDMTMYPGDGAFALSSMRDFTDAGLRQWLLAFNDNVLHARVIDDQCGYGCSDHASWHRQGYPALMPSESTFDNMNRNIHTSRDVVDSASNFEHAAIFSKIAVGFALSLN